MCHGILGFWGGYELTGQKEYMEAMTKFAQAVAKGIMKGNQATVPGNAEWPFRVCAGTLRKQE
jgi:hypothetical protein